MQQPPQSRYDERQQPEPYEKYDGYGHRPMPDDGLPTARPAYPDYPQQRPDPGAWPRTQEDLSWQQPRLGGYQERAPYTGPEQPRQSRYDEPPRGYEQQRPERAELPDPQNHGARPGPRPGGGPGGGGHGSSSAQGSGAPGEQHARLNPKYLFDTFVIGSSNRFAHAAAVAVAEAPAEGVQPALHLRGVGARQDAPAARDRTLRAEPLPGHARAVRELRGVHERVHQLDPRRQG